jgi:hypothetical protein
MLDAWISGSRVGTHSARLNQIPITSASSGGFWPFFSRERIAHTLAGVYLTCRACCVTQASSGWGYSLQDARVGCQSRPKRGRARRAAVFAPVSLHPASCRAETHPLGTLPPVLAGPPRYPFDAVLAAQHRQHHDRQQALQTDTCISLGRPVSPLMPPANSSSRSTHNVF